MLKMHLLYKSGYKNNGTKYAEIFIEDKLKMLLNMENLFVCNIQASEFRSFLQFKKPCSLVKKKSY